MTVEGVHGADSSVQETPFQSRTVSPITAVQSVGDGQDTPFRPSW